MYLAVLLLWYRYVADINWLFTAEKNKKYTDMLFIFIKYTESKAL